MIISKDSALRHIPTAMVRRQALFIEAIRFTIETADLAHRRLQQTLVVLADRAQYDAKTASLSGVSAMSDSWSIVDALHRLRGLMQAVPGLKGRKHSVFIRPFLDSTANIEKLRNTVQHLDTTIPVVVTDDNWAVLGSLSWGVVDSANSLITACVFLPGSPRGSHPVINPMDRQIWQGPVDSITIERSGVAVCLSDAMRKVEKLAAGLEKSLSNAYTKQIPNMKTYPPDGVITVVLQVDMKQVIPEGAPYPESDSI